MSNKMRLYKGRYLIAIYNKNDEFINVVDNAQQFSKYTGMNRNCADSFLSFLSKAGRASFGTGVNKMFVYLIEFDEE